MVSLMSVGKRSVYIRNGALAILYKKKLFSTLKNAGGAAEAVKMSET